MVRIKNFPVIHVHPLLDIVSGQIQLFLRKVIFTDVPIVKKIPRCYRAYFTVRFILSDLSCSWHIYLNFEYFIVFRH